MAISIGINDCSSDQMGTALKGCLKKMEQISKLIFLEKGIELNIKTDTLDSNKVKELIQTGKMIVLPIHNSVENATEAAVYASLGSGIKLFVRQGLYELLLQYPGSICLGKSLNQLSNNYFDLLLVDSSDTLFGEETKDGYFKGFDLALYQGENMSFNDGANPSQKPLRVQLSTYGTQAFNDNINFISSSDVSFLSLEGVTDVYLDVISSKANDFQVKVVNGCDKSTIIEGLDNVKYWSLTNASTLAPVTPTSVTYTNGIYKLVGVSAADYLLKLYENNTTTVYNILSIGTNFFKTFKTTQVVVTP